MGKKYIIELEDKPFHKEDGDFLCRVKGFNSLVFDMTGIGMLTPYTEPDMEQVRKEAYDNGYETAKHECEDCPKQAYTDALKMETYQKGLSDAWEAAKKVVALSTVDRRKVFGSEYMYSILEKHTASEAIEKLKAYEQEQNEIQVGDEVIRHYKNEFMEGDDAPSIFLSEEDGHFRCLAFNGRSIMIAEYPKNQYRKTGRHFPEIAEVLRKMREADNG